MKKVEKQSIPVVIENEEPIAIVFYNKNRDRIIYMLEKAGEDDIIDLLETKNENTN
jgi:hypothetical protein